MVYRTQILAARPNSLAEGQRQLPEKHSLRVRKVRKVGKVLRVMTRTPFLAFLTFLALAPTKRAAS
jgi:hypothetical protein